MAPRYNMKEYRVGALEMNQTVFHAKAGPRDT